MNPLIELYTELYGPLDADARRRNKNLDELAARLSAIAHRAKPWTRRYLLSIINGYDGFTITPDLADAINRAGAVADGAHPLSAELTQITVFSINGNVKPGAIILGKSKQCEDCRVLFVGTVPWQKRCPDCGQKRRKRTRS